MTFTLTYEIAENVTRRDMALALRRAASLLEKTVGTFEDGDRQPIRDTAGDVVGEWNVG